MTYGCHNRKPFQDAITVQAGWSPMMRPDDQSMTRVPFMTQKPFTMARDCQYTKTTLGQADARCDGCRWRETDESRNNTSTNEESSK